MQPARDGPSCERCMKLVKLVNGRPPLRSPDSWPRPHIPWVREEKRDLRPTAEDMDMLRDNDNADVQPVGSAGRFLAVSTPYPVVHLLSIVVVVVVVVVG